MTANAHRSPTDDAQRARHALRRARIERGMRELAFDSRALDRVVAGRHAERASMRFGAGACCCRRCRRLPRLQDPTRRRASLRRLLLDHAYPAQMTEPRWTSTAVAAVPRAVRVAVARVRRCGGGEVAFAAAPAGARPQAARAGRAQGRQRRPQHARALRRPGVLRAAPEDRDRARPRGAALRSRGTASGARAARCRCGRRSDSRCCRASAIPAPNLSHFRSIEIWDTAARERRVSAGRLADARVRRAPRSAVVRRRRRHRRQQRARPARRRRHARDRARRHRAVPAPRAARAPARRARQQGARAHPQGGSRHRAGGRRTSSATHAFETEFPAGGSATRSGPRARSSPIPPASPSCASRCRLRHARQSAGHAGAAARRARATASSRCKSALDELGRWNDTLVLTYCGVRTAPEGKPDSGHRPRHGQRALRARRPRAGRLLRRGARPRDGLSATAIRATRSTFAPSTRRCSIAGGASMPRLPLRGRFEPVPFVST